MFLNQMWKGVSKISSLSSTPLPPPPATNLVGPPLPPHYLAGPLSSVALPRQISLLRQRTLEKLLDPPWVWATGSRKMFSSQTPPSYFLLSPLWKDHKIQICQLLPLHPFVEFFGFWWEPHLLQSNLFGILCFLVHCVGQIKKNVI